MPIIFNLALILTAVYLPLLSSTIMSGKELKIRHSTLTKGMLSDGCYLSVSCAKIFGKLEISESHTHFQVAIATNCQALTSCLKVM
jgi:hypothetical protein